MTWLPIGRVAMVNVIAPFDRVPTPSWVAGVDVPSSKVTVPVGVPAAGAMGETVAAKVIGCPRTAGFEDDDTLSNGVDLPIAYR